MLPADRAYLITSGAACLAGLLWRLLHRRSYTRWRDWVQVGGVGPRPHLERSRQA